MKIVHIVFNRLGQGTYWRSFFFARELVRMRHEVTILVTSPRNRHKIEESWQDGVQIIQTPDLFSGSLRSGWDAWNTLRRIFWLKGKHFDLVHAFESRPTVVYPALYLHQKTGIPLVMDWADWFGKGGSVEQRPNPVVRMVLRPVETFFEENFRSRANATTVICSELYRRAERLGIPTGSIQVIHNGCNTNQAPMLDIQAARSLVQLPDHLLLIGYVGSIFRADAELMAKAFDIVAERLPGVGLILAGYFPLDLRKLTRFPNLVYPLGKLNSEDLSSVLSSCDLFWLPLQNTNANRGRWPLKLNDYMTAGRPCVATAVGDVKFLFDHEPIGVLCQDKPDDLAKKTIDLMGDEESRKRMGLHARSLAEGPWNWSEKTKDLEEIYSKVTQGNHRG